MATWTNSKHDGVRYREHPTRKHGVRKDRYYSIRYYVDGKRIEESLGWETDWHQAELARKEKGEATGRSLEQEAVVRRADLLANQENGAGPRTLSEKKALKEAEERARKEKEEAEALARAEAERKAVPYNDIWGRYIDQCKADGKKSTDREESLHTHWVKPVIGNRPLSEIAPIHLEKIKSNMSKSGAAPRSIHYALAVIRQVFNYASREGLYGGDNPTGKIKKPKADNRRMRFLTQKEAENLLKELESAPNSRRITLLSLHCGLRFGEIAALTWGDIDLDRGALCIRNPKNGSTRHTYLTDAARAELLEMEPGGKSDLVFPDRKGNRRHQMSDAFDRAVKRLGLNDGVQDDRQKVVFHTCRHSFASWLVEGGTGLFTVRELLGHKSLAMTERYSHLQPDTLRRAVKELDQRLQADKIIDLTHDKTL